MSLGLFILSFWVMGHGVIAAPISTPDFQNKIQDFFTDGCSRFPDGVPLSKSLNWKECCIVHDISYWQGGTYAQRKQADEELSQCVENIAGSTLSYLMYLGVRIGGMNELPTTWHWGYGWLFDRGYGPLTAKEQKQVDEKIKNIPEDLDQIPLVSPNIIRNRISVTGNHCLDIAVFEIQKTLNTEFSITHIKEINTTTPEGYNLNMSVQTDVCIENFNFNFLLMKKNSCTDQMSQLMARGRIRLLNSDVPKTCFN